MSRLSGLTYVELRITASALVEGSLSLGSRLDGVDARAGSSWCRHFEYVVGGWRWLNWVSDGVDGGGMMLAWRCAMLRFWEGSAKYGDLNRVTCGCELGVAD